MVQIEQRIRNTGLKTEIKKAAQELWAPKISAESLTLFHAVSHRDIHNK